MNIDELTIGEVKKLTAMIGMNTKQDNHSLKIGEKVFIRTVTMHFTGQITAITESDIVLKDAAWIADSGRFSHALSTGELNEVEPYPDGVIISRGGLIDISPWNHKLPREIK